MRTRPRERVSICAFFDMHQVHDAIPNIEAASRSHVQWEVDYVGQNKSLAGVLLAGSVSTASAQTYYAAQVMAITERHMARMGDGLRSDGLQTIRNDGLTLFLSADRNVPSLLTEPSSSTPSTTTRTPCRNPAASIRSQDSDALLRTDGLYWMDGSLCLPGPQAHSRLIGAGAASTQSTPARANRAVSASTYAASTRIIDLWVTDFSSYPISPAAICLNEAKRNGASLPVTALVDNFYAEVQKMGGTRWDTSSLIARLEK